MSDLIVRTHTDGVTTLRMNNPRKLNGWTTPMMAALKSALAKAASDDATKVVVFTGTDPYYSAGVNFGGALKPAGIRSLHAQIRHANQTLFEAFLTFPKPIIAAVNGPAIGAPVTSATLCDALIASDKATFSTPFAALGVAREGCSSVHFDRIMAHEDAERMLGPEGFRPDGTQAAAMGLATEVVPHDQLLDRAQALAAEWVAAGKTRAYRGGSTLDELVAVNAQEAIAVADSIFSKRFLKAQARFLWSKNKRGPALMFATAYATRPVWSRVSGVGR